MPMTTRLKSTSIKWYHPVILCCLLLAGCGGGSGSVGMTSAAPTVPVSPISAPTLPPVPSNSAPIASAIHVNGTVTAGSVLTGLYTYADIDGDVEGISTFRWLRDGVPITGATSSMYTLTLADIKATVGVAPTVGTSISFEVTPIAATGALKGTPVSYAVITKAKALHPIGTNLAWIRDWSNEIVFNDAFKRARSWVSVVARNMAANTSPIAVDANGWVTKLAPNQWVVSYIFIFGQAQHLPTETYRCSYTGNGIITITNATVLAFGSGWMDIKFNQGGSGTVSVVIQKTDPLNYIKNIKIQPLNTDGTVNTATFRADFLNRWRPFDTIRFMDWMDTNFVVNYKPQFATAINWTDRPKVTDFSQATENGVALEYMIELCNTLKINPWFNMPATATDAYITQFATMVKNKLDPSLKAYVEYSNEVWNFGFPAAQYANTMGAKLGLGALNGQAFIHFYTHRSLQVLGIWTNIFGRSATTRLVRVLSGQSAYLGLSQQIFDYELAYSKIDAFAIAPYFSWNSNLTVNPVPPMNAMFASVDANLVALNTLFGQYALMTKTRNVKLIAYEGGNSMVSPNNPALTAMAAQMNRDPYMYQLYTRYLTNWSLSGGGLFMNFSSVIAPSKWGNWGVLEWYDLPVSPTSKYAAIKDALYRP